MNRPRVLIIDDEPSNLGLLRQILKEEYSLFFAKGGEEGLAAVERHEPALILLDVRMPDMGKIGIPDYILKKPGPLTEEEWAIMRTHPRIGYEILKRSDGLIFRMAAEIALHHHEKWDGSGYPAGETGEGIPEASRIVAIADVFDALSVRRPYKDPWPLEQVLATMRDGAGQHFDPRLFACFLEIMPEILRLKAQWDTREERGITR